MKLKPSVESCDTWRRVRRHRRTGPRQAPSGGKWHGRCLEMGGAASRRGPRRPDLKRTHWIPAVAATLAIAAAFAFTSMLPPAAGAKPSAEAAEKPANSVEAVEDAALTRLGIAILAISGIGAASLWLVRKVKASALTGGKRERGLQVVEMLPLGGKRSLAVARVYDRVLVLGMTDASVSLLTELKDDEAGLEAELPNEQLTPAPKSSGAEHFRSLLSRMTSQRTIAPQPRRTETRNKPAPAHDELVAAAARAEVEDLL